MTNYDTPMFGQVTINWSAGVDEDGTVVGYIGVPEKPGELLDSEGVALAFQEPIVEYGDASIIKGVRVTMVEALNKDILPLIIPAMVEALKELRERQGGYQPKENEAEEA